ncbi:MAG: AI-2E family transporter [Pseudomonadota bacterium]
MEPSKPDLRLSEEDTHRLGALVMDIAIRMFFVGLLIWFSLSIVGPFAMVVLWAIILTVAMYPVYSWLRGKLGSGGRSSTLITFLGLLIILGPAAVLVTSMIETVGELTDGLQDGTLKAPPPPDTLQGIPVIGPKIHALWIDVSTNFSGFIADHGDQVYTGVKTALGSIAGFGGAILLFAVSIIISAFLYGPGPELAENIRVFARRVAGARGGEFVDMAGSTIRNVSRGVVGISLIQSLLAGVGLLVVGVPAAGLIALGVLVLGIIQVGPLILLLPVIIWVWSSMTTVVALMFTIYIVPVVFLDNVLKPIVMSKGLKTPMLVIFIGVIGGTLSYGLIGLFAGPIVLAVVYELLITWVRLGDDEDAATNNATDHEARE